MDDAAQLTQSMWGWLRSWRARGRIKLAGFYGWGKQLRTRCPFSSKKSCVRLDKTIDRFCVCVDGRWECAQCLPPHNYFFGSNEDYY